MLDTLRRHSQSYLVYLFFGILIVVFVFFFGPQSRGCSANKMVTVGEVGSRAIGSLQLEQLYQRVDLVERGLPEDQQIPPGARRRQLAEDLVLIRLLAEEARGAGMAVSDDQFAAYIADPDRNPDFRNYADRAGEEFDYERYETRVPGIYGMSLPEYEAWKEDELLAQLYLESLAQAVTVTDEEVANLHRLRETRYDLEFIRFEPASLTDLLALSDSEVAGALAADRDRFATYYDEHTDEFEQPRTLRARRIFIRLPGESDPDARAQALERYEAALELVRSDPDSFADVAREYSQSTDAEEGGDMGLKTAEAYRSFPFLEDRLDDIEVGAIETYESQVSRIIFRVEEDNPANTPAFDEVAETVARTVLENERGDEPVADLAEWFLEQARQGMTLEEVAIEHARRQAPTTTEDGDSDEGAAASDEGDVAGDSDREAEDEGSDAATEDEGGDEGDDVEPLVTVQRTGLFALDDPGMDLSQFGPQFAGQFAPPREPASIPRLGNVPELARDLSQLTEDNPVAPRVYHFEDAYLAVRLADIEPAPETIDDETRESLHDAIWRDKTRVLLGSWRQRLLAHRPIALGLLLEQRLQAALETGEASLQERYFAEPEEPAPAP